MAVDYIDVEVTAEEIEHAVEVANVITGDKVQKELTAGNNITITDNQDGTQTINSAGGGGGTTDYDDLTHKPRQKYTPSSAQVSVTNINNGIYDVASAFELVLDSSHTIPIQAGAVLCVYKYNTVVDGFVLGGDGIYSAVAFYKPQDDNNYYISDMGTYVWALSTYAVWNNALAQTTGTATDEVMSQKAVTDALSGKLSNPLIFTNVSATFSANSDTDYSDYSYKAVLSCQGVTASMLATVIFADAQAKSGDYALTCVTGANSVTIYSNDNTSITIPTIIAGLPIEVEVTGGSGLNYSTTEHIVGTWIDGEPVYEQSTTIPAMTNIKNADFFTIPDLKAVISFDAYAIQNNGSENDDGIWGVSNGLGTKAFRILTGGVIRHTQSVTFSGVTTATIRYTKTTD